MNTTEKLLKAVFQILELKQGEVQVNSEGEKYRYDLYVTKYPTTHNWFATVRETGLITILF